LWSWEDSAAHFNPAITLASFVHAAGGVRGVVANVKPLVSLIVVQIIGAFFGLFVTYLVSRIQKPAENVKTTQPAVPTLCPPLGCITQGLDW
jgi:glycerol uptake facilitator-like aquaporin